MLAPTVIDGTVRRRLEGCNHDAADLAGEEFLLVRAAQHPTTVRRPRLQAGHLSLQALDLLLRLRQLVPYPADLIVGHVRIFVQFG